MWEVNIKNIKSSKNGYIITMSKTMNYTGYQAFIPKKFVHRKDYFRIINLPDNQKLKIKKDNDIRIVTIGDIKNEKRKTNTIQL